MKCWMILGAVIAFLPAVSVAQTAPVSATAGATSPTAQQQAAWQRLRLEMQQSRLQTRARLLAALTPAHRMAVANIVGQLALAANPDPAAAARELDTVMTLIEKQSVVNISAAERANRRLLMQQQRAAFEATMTAEQRAQMAQREAKRQAYMQSHSRPGYIADPGAIVLRTLGGFAGRNGMRGTTM